MSQGKETTQMMDRTDVIVRSLLMALFLVILYITFPNFDTSDYVRPGLTEGQVIGIFVLDFFPALIKSLLIAAVVVYAGVFVWESIYYENREEAKDREWPGTLDLFLKTLFGTTETEDTDETTETENSDFTVDLNSLTFEHTTQTYKDQEIDYIKTTDTDNTFDYFFTDKKYLKNLKEDFKLKPIDDILPRSKDDFPQYIENNVHPAKYEDDKGREMYLAPERLITALSLFTGSENEYRPSDFRLWQPQILAQYVLECSNANGELREKINNELPNNTNREFGAELLCLIYPKSTRLPSN